MTALGYRSWWLDMENLISFLRTPTAQLVLGFSGLFILTTIGIYIVRRFRDSSEDAETSSALLTKFEESRGRGELNDSEFRTIKTILAERMQAELKRSDEAS